MKTRYKDENCEAVQKKWKFETRIRLFGKLLVHVTFYGVVFAYNKGICCCVFATGVDVPRKKAAAN